MKRNINQHSKSLLQSIQSMMNKASQVFIFRHILDLFLNTEKRTTLQNVTGVSPSTASRFLNSDMVDDTMVRTL